jgi:hypothetical protein
MTVNCEKPRRSSRSTGKADRRLQGADQRILHLNGLPPSSTLRSEALPTRLGDPRGAREPLSPWAPVAIRGWT